MSREHTVIAITQRLAFIDAYEEERESLDSQWHTFAQDLGNVLLIPISYKSDPATFLDQLAVNCVILSGGNDVYKHEHTPKDAAEALSVKRDAFERALVIEAKARNIRVLGVCRGLQLLLLHYGAGLAPVSRHVGRSHALVRYSGSSKPHSKYVLECYSKLFEDDGALKGETVNSFHNYGPHMTPHMHANVEVLAMSADEDIIEAFVHESDGVAGIMWHPERSYSRARDRDISLVRVLLGVQPSQVSTSTLKQIESHGTEVYAIVLCAGQGTRLRPLTDAIPKCMVKYKGRAIIDYMLSVFSYHGVEDITLVTGYKANELRRPGVKYIHNTDYGSSNMVKSLFCALDTFTDATKDLIVSYSDIIYTQDVLRTLLSSKPDDSDIMVVIDKQWLSLWQRRMEDPLLDAETLKVDADGYIKEIGKKPRHYDDVEGQYIGLMKFTAAGVHALMCFFRSLDTNRMYDGKSIENMYMTTLLQLMIDSGIKIRPVFINGGWTEIDCQEDLKVDIDFSMIPNTFRGQSLNFGTKAETLESLRRLNFSRVLPLIYFTRSEWQDNSLRNHLLDKCMDLVCATGDLLIVRSSAFSEDSLESSAAGLHDTIKNVSPTIEYIENAVMKVFASYRAADVRDQVLVQPMLRDVAACGVICTTELRDYTPYFVLSYEDGGGTDAVTSGARGAIKTLYASKYFLHRVRVSEWQKEVFEVAKTLEEKFQNDKLDIEFAVTVDGDAYVLQVRPVVVPLGLPKMLHPDFATVLEEVKTDLVPKLPSHEVLDNMMDWNPAEMIGALPSTLARSIYELLITDKIAMESRAMLGYRDVSHEPLMHTVAGRPFIRASVSFESFIPASLDSDLAGKLLRHYLVMLRKYPEKHDKVEFEIVFSCFEPNLSERLDLLSDFGFTSDEQNRIRESLLVLTNSILSRVEDDLATVALLPSKVLTIKNQKSKDPLARVKHTVELIQTFGTLPFANLARCAFIAISLLKSLQRLGHLPDSKYNEFMESLHTVGKDLGKDLASFVRGEITKDEFLSTYGHLRPGTYDICTPRYDENFALYFSDLGVGHARSEASTPKFHMDADVQTNITTALQGSGMTINCAQLLDFCRKSIEGREKAKFIFTAAISDILVDITEIGDALNIHKFDMSFLDLKALLKEDMMCNRAVILENILHNRSSLRSKSKVKLPTTIRAVDDLYAHQEFTARPNFVTKKCVAGDVVIESNLFAKPLKGKIIVVESADPGWDWLFSNSIRGLVTCYGGANSHMAIRAAELSLPAAIGVGTVKFTAYTDARKLQINALAQTITILE
jgi:choline kinase/gamma-glutamyl-gamma-aminobutyrate hydrolase PuuD/phosphohistidine swiveling domain-containing protein